MKFIFICLIYPKEPYKLYICLLNISFISSQLLKSFPLIKYMILNFLFLISFSLILAKQEYKQAIK